MGTPSGKNNPGATPTQFTSSPFPSGIPMGRPLSHKSPSIRTPSASGQYHQNHPSTSSQQYPTPLAAAASAEDAAAFSSPSALLALGLGGITPSLGAGEGMTGQGMNVNDIQGMEVPALTMTGPRDNEEEKRRRLDEVLQTLRTRVAGRGVCREGVERLGKLEGLECLWQDDNLSIAGNLVDLEMEFGPGTEYVKDVVLRYATPEAEEGEKREEATAVLKRNLIQSPEDQDLGFWKSMTGFHENLRHLARMDQLSQDVNCLHAIEGVYESLKRIWEEERRSRPWSSWEHVCSGSVGRPCMHLGEKLGLSLQYWADRRRLLDSKSDKSEDRMDVDRPDSGDTNGQHEEVKSHTMVIECEEGYPSLRVSKEWVYSPEFTTMNTEEDTGNGGDGDGISLINWNEPPPTLLPNNNGDAMALDPSSMMSNSSTPNRRFVAHLEPPIEVPIIAASEIYRVLGMNMPQEYKFSTYDSLVLPCGAEDGASQSGEKLASTNERQAHRKLYAFDGGGQLLKREHNYVFHTFEQVAGRALRDLPFSHPRQLSDVLPILRQYALLSSILRRIFPNTQSESREGETNDQEPTADDKSIPPFLSNTDPTEKKLDSILSNGSTRAKQDAASTVPAPPPYTSTPSSTTSSTTATKIDVSLRTSMSSAPSILLLLNIPKPDSQQRQQQQQQTQSGPAAEPALRTISMRVDVNLNGRLSVSDISGLGLVDGEGEDDGVEQTELGEKLAKVLETCEDLGLFVEWIVRWLTRREHGDN